MGDEELVLRASIKDELSAPLEQVRGKVKATGEAVSDLDRKADSAARGGIDRLQRASSRASSEVGGRLATASRWGASAVTNVGNAAARAGSYGFDKLSTAASTATRWIGGKLVAAAKWGAIGLGILTAAAAGVGIKTAASMETSTIAFTTMLGSAKDARAFLVDLNKFAAATPFDFPGLVAASSSLISAGIETKKIIPIMTTLGNVTSGMGTGAEGVQRATVAIQQMTAAGKINGEDLNQLRDAGVPVYDLLAAAMHKSKAEIAGLAQEGKLGAEGLTAMMKALETGEGLERFTGLMEKQSHTLTGLSSTFKDTIQMGLAKAMTPVIPLLKEGILYASDLATRAMPKLQDVLDRLVRWFNSDGRAMLSDWFGKLKNDGIPAMKHLYEKVKPLAETALPAMGTALGVIADAIDVMAPKLTAVFDGFNNLPDWAKTAIMIGAGGAAVGKKLGAFSLGKKALDAATGGGVQKVFVVNQLGGAGVGGAAAGGSKLGSVAMAVGKVFLPAAAAYIIGDYVTKHAPPKALPFGGEDENGNQKSGWMPWSGNGTSWNHPWADPPEGYGKRSEGWTSWFNGKDDRALNQKDAADFAASKIAARTELAKTAAAFATLPRALQTDIVLHGGPESRAEAKALAKQYDLTAEDRTTLFKTSGIPQAMTGTSKLLQQYGFLSRPITANFTLTGVEAAQAKIDSFMGGLGGALPSIPSGAPVVPKKRHREHGGPVKAGLSYLVGEKRAELFVPNTDGKIVPRVPAPVARTHSAMGAGGDTRIVVEAGAVVVHNPADGIEIEHAVAAGIARYVREREERS